MSRKHRSLTLRHKRLNRSGRLRAAKAWMASYAGKNIARGYRKYFGVDLFCAVRELRMLGITIDPACEAAVLAAGPYARKRKGESKKKEQLTKKLIGDLHSSLDTRRGVCPTA